MIDFTDLKNIGRPIIIGHRGAPKAARENTVEAFEKAMALGVDAVEFDVRRTADDVLVVHHNARVTPNTQRIALSPYEKVQKAARGRGYEVPTLDEVLDVCRGRVSIDVELKETGYEEEVIEAVLKKFDLRHVMFKSFRESCVKKLMSYEPSLFAGLLLGYKIDISKGSGLRKKISPLARVQRTGAQFVSPHWRLLRRGFIDRMHEAGLPVFTWTVNDPRVALRLIRRGVDGIITNVPDEMATLR